MRTVIAAVAATAVVASCGVVPSDPLVSDSAIRFDGKLIETVVALCPGERVFAGVVEKENGRAAFEMPRESIINQRSLGFISFEKSRLSFSTFTAAVDAGYSKQKPRTNFQDTTLRELSMNRNDWLYGGKTITSLQELKPAGCEDE